MKVVSISFFIVGKQSLKLEDSVIVHQLASEENFISFARLLDKNVTSSEIGTLGVALIFIGQRTSHWLGGASTKQCMMLPISLGLRFRGCSGLIAQLLDLSMHLGSFTFQLGIAFF